ncbi:MAG: hypothetical protein AABN34_10745 [Acidobacteriota bacterium]
MNSLLGVLLIAAMPCASAAAQQGSAAAQQGNKDVAAVSTIRARLLAQEDQAVHPTPGFKLAPEFSQIRIPTEGQRRVELLLGAVVLLLPQWVWKEGALYLDVGLLGNEMLIPVPGGRASGCFGASLPERIEKLRTSIEAFPPRPLSATPPRQ